MADLFPSRASRRAPRPRGHARGHRLRHGNCASRQRRSAVEHAGVQVRSRGKSRQDCPARTSQANGCRRHRREGRADRDIQLRRLRTHLGRIGVGVGRRQLWRARQWHHALVLDPSRPGSVPGWGPDCATGEPDAVRRRARDRHARRRLGMGPRRRRRSLLDRADPDPPGRNCRCAKCHSRPARGRTRCSTPTGRSLPAATARTGFSAPAPRRAAPHLRVSSACPRAHA